MLLIYMCVNTTESCLILKETDVISNRTHIIEIPGAK